MITTVFNSKRIQTKHKYEIFGEQTNYSLFLSQIYTLNRNNIFKNLKTAKAILFAGK